MKHVLVFFVIILTLIPVVKAEDDDWIDGITFRLTRTFSNLNIHYYQNDLEIMGSQEPGNVDIDHLNQQSFIVPIAIELSENLMSSWSYHSAFFDFEYNKEFNDYNK